MKLIGIQELGKDKYLIGVEGDHCVYKKMGDKNKSSYEVKLGDSGLPICGCKGYSFRGECKHAKHFEQLLPELMEKHFFEPVEPEIEPGKFARSEVEHVVEIITERIKEINCLVEVAGSFRRGKDSIKDLDFVTTADSEEILELFGAGNILLVSGTKVIRFNLELSEGQEIQIDFALTTPAFLGSCLMYLTGSKEFNIQMRRRAKSMGLKLSRLGLEDRETHEILAVETEKDIFSGLKMDFVPPSCREEGIWEDYIK